jgi:TonB-dependent SusC/RagA subfamily outer membrane receptor
MVIVDGTPVLLGPGGGLSGLNPRDIASIEVIKDVSRLAMYGVRGANGVIVVKTKAAASQ